MFVACCASCCCKAAIFGAPQEDHVAAPSTERAHDSVIQRDEVLRAGVKHHAAGGLNDGPAVSAATGLLGPDGTFVDLTTRHGDMEQRLIGSHSKSVAADGSDLTILPPPRRRDEGAMIVDSLEPPLRLPPRRGSMQLYSPPQRQHNGHGGAKHSLHSGTSSLGEDPLGRYASADKKRNAAATQAAGSGGEAPGELGLLIKMVRGEKVSLDDLSRASAASQTAPSAQASAGVNASALTPSWWASMIARGRETTPQTLAEITASTAAPQTQQSRKEQAKELRAKLRSRE
jgi:hypothetical protein